MLFSRLTLAILAAAGPSFWATGADPPSEGGVRGAGATDENRELWASYGPYWKPYCETRHGWGSACPNPCGYGSSHDLYKSHCARKHKYIQCEPNSGRCFEKACAPGTVWNDYINSCVHGKTYYHHHPHHPPTKPHPPITKPPPTTKPPPVVDCSDYNHNLDACSAYSEQGCRWCPNPNGGIENLMTAGLCLEKHEVCCENYNWIDSDSMNPCSNVANWYNTGNTNRDCYVGCNAMGYEEVCMTGRCCNEMNEDEDECNEVDACQWCEEDGCLPKIFGPCPEGD